MAEGGILGSFIGALSPSIIRASGFINQGLALGLSANEIARTLSTAGLGVRRTDLLSYVRTAKNAFGAATYQKGLKGDILPNPSNFSGSRYFMKRRYAYVVQITGHNPITGESGTVFRTISTDTVLTNDQWEQEAAFIASGEGGSTPWVADRYDLNAVLTDPRFLP